MAAIIPVDRSTSVRAYSVVGAPGPVWLCLTGCHVFKREFLHLLFTSKDSF